MGRTDLVNLILGICPDADALKQLLAKVFKEYFGPKTLTMINFRKTFLSSTNKQIHRLLELNEETIDLIYQIYTPSNHTILTKE